ncbi:VanZ family protein [Pseudalkalibacillus berkeleyi]|uniref:VanZ family protein n=1 Tax=Pseudalkalibacillus berkeleyi TaxID=1069813 RepID=A0ABS9H5A5_9BACL|nr:VanZ family protein [Pseudalkalibacillus berkeleyi]MCF6139291.1 VanZ family protein [Pseudalkalibacillus berkeleyi]
MEINNAPGQHRQIRSRWKWIGVILFIAYFAVLIYSTLFTFNYYIYGKSFNLVLFDSIRLMWRSGNYWLIFKNVIGNFLLFMPLGFLLPLISRKLARFRRMFFISFGMSAVIELVQFNYANRIFDIDDIFLNGLGGLVGLILYKVLAFFYRLIERNRRK